MRTWEYVFLKLQQYRNRQNFVVNATPTAMIDGKWNSVVSSAPLLVAMSREDMTIRMSETDIMRKQNTILPAVSRRALPEGNRLASTLLTARWDTMRRRLERGSKTESAMVANNDRDPEATAP